MDRQLPVLIADPSWGSTSYAGEIIGGIARLLREKQHEVHGAITAADGRALIQTQCDVGCVLVSARFKEKELTGLIEAAHELSESVPIFLMAERAELGSLNRSTVERVAEYVWILDDTPSFIAGRVHAAAERYARTLLPPFFEAMVDYAERHEYSWHTPGHTGGTAFLKSPVGKEFFDFFGEQLFRSDLSVSVEELGSLLDHSGPVGAAEEYAARVFGADRTYFVTNGTSTSNRIVFQASVVDGSAVVVDRNCHKSIEQSLTLTGAVPYYLVPHRNMYGIIGPVSPKDLRGAWLKKQVQAHRLLRHARPPEVVEHLVLTNSTYDGLCYNVGTVLKKVGPHVKRLHFDEAWYAYARFNPMYDGRYAMSIDKVDLEGDAPTLFATQSTHKLLAALSQASMIHVRNGSLAPVEHDRFNEAFMMHSSTSPQYAIIASNDVATGMMDGKGGYALTQEAIQEAVAFRQTMARLAHGSPKTRSWFVPWQPKSYEIGRRRVRFENVPHKKLCTDSKYWELVPGAAWHGFPGLERGYCLLDPIKVTMIAPGLTRHGAFEDPDRTPCAPAVVVSAFLDSRGIVVEKTGDYTLLFLFSIGITKGKWGTLVNALLEFQRLYERNEPLAVALPELVRDHPDTYGTLGLRDLCVRMHREMQEVDVCRKLHDAFDTKPEQSTTPSDAYRMLVRGEAERVRVDDLVAKTVAVGVVPYPPGIPLFMPGEQATSEGAEYLSALQRLDRAFPGFEHEIHGVTFAADPRGPIEVSPAERSYWVYCLNPH